MEGGVIGTILAGRVAGSALKRVLFEIVLSAVAHLVL